MTTTFSKSDARIEALVALMGAASLTSADLQAAMLELAAENDRTGRAWAKLYQGRFDLDDVARFMDMTADEFMDRLVVRMFHRHGTPEKGCALRARRVTQ